VARACAQDRQQQNIIKTVSKNMAKENRNSWKILTEALHHTEISWEDLGKLQINGQCGETLKLASVLVHVDGLRSKVICACRFSVIFQFCSSAKKYNLYRTVAS